MLFIVACKAGSFWHGGNSIMSISLDEQPIQMAELISIQNEHKDLCKNSFLDRGITYMLKN